MVPQNDSLMLTRMKIKLKRVYESPQPSDGYRILVDRLWPRGLSKAEAQVDLWLRDLAPSAPLRKWFAHAAERWPEFKRRYALELRDKPDLVKLIQKKAARQVVTLLYAAKASDKNNAVCLREFLLKQAG